MDASPAPRALRPTDGPVQWAGLVFGMTTGELGAVNLYRTGYVCACKRGVWVHMQVPRLTHQLRGCKCGHDAVLLALVFWRSTCSIADRWRRHSLALDTANCRAALRIPSAATYGHRDRHHCIGDECWLQSHRRTYIASEQCPLRCPR